MQITFKNVDSCWFHFEHFCQIKLKSYRKSLSIHWMVCSLDFPYRRIHRKNVKKVFGVFVFLDIEAFLARTLGLPIKQFAEKAILCLYLNGVEREPVNLCLNCPTLVFFGIELWTWSLHIHPRSIQLLYEAIGFLLCFACAEVNFIFDGRQFWVWRASQQHNPV